MIGIYGDGEKLTGNVNRRFKGSFICDIDINGQKQQRKIRDRNSRIDVNIVSKWHLRFYILYEIFWKSFGYRKKGEIVDVLLTWKSRSVFFISLQN